MSVLTSNLRPFKGIECSATRSDSMMDHYGTQLSVLSQKASRPSLQIQHSKVLVSFYSSNKTIRIGFEILFFTHRKQQTVQITEIKDAATAPPVDWSDVLGTSHLK